MLTILEQCKAFASIHDDYIRKDTFILIAKLSEIANQDFADRFIPMADLLCQTLAYQNENQINAARALNNLTLINDVVT